MKIFISFDGEGVAGKGSVTRFAAAAFHPKVAREMISAGDMAHLASWVKGDERSGTRPTRIAGDDPLEIYQAFTGITYITQVSEGR